MMNGKSVQNSQTELIKEAAGVSQQDIRLSSLRAAAAAGNSDDAFNTADENDKLREDETNKKETKRELSMFTKICFAMSGLTYQMYFCAISVYATVFLLNSAGLPPSKNLVILFVSRIIDAITDVVYGYFVEKSPITRYGKMKPWIFFSIPISALSYIMMWYIPESFTENGLFVWFLFWHSLFFTVLTGIRIPHTAMTMYLCSSLEERESATIYRMGLEMVGLLLALAIQGPFMASLKCISGDDNTSLNDTIINNTSSPSFLLVADDQSHLREVFKTVKESQTVFEKNIYVIFAAILTVIFLIGNYMLIFFVEEKKELLEASDKSKTSQEDQIRTQTELKRIFTFRPYVLLAMATILSTSAVQVVQANMELYFKYGYDALADQFAYAILILLVFGCLFVPIWKYFMLRVEKKYLYIVGNLTMVPLMIGTFFFKTSQIGEVVVFYGLSMISANCFTAVFLVPWAMLPEVLDAYFLKYNTRPDAFFFTLFNLGSKIFMAVYFGLTQLVLSLVNYKNNYCTQDEGVKTAVINLFSPVAIGLLIIGSVFAYFYPIDSAKAKQNSEEIKSRSHQEVEKI